MTWSPQPEMMWIQDSAVDAARKLPAWVAFHRACGKVGLFFDHPTKEGRRGYTYDAFTVEERHTRLLATGRGATVLAALGDAHERSGRASEETRKLLAGMAGLPVGQGDDFDALLGGAADDDFDSLL